MKKIALFGAALAAMAMSPAFAQSTDAQGAVTRAEVKQELRELVRAGYDPTDSLGFPSKLATAERKISAQSVTTVSDAAQPAPLTLTQSNTK